MRDNLDFFKKFVVELPSARILLASVLALGVVMGMGAAWLLSPETGLRSTLLDALFVSALFFIIPALVSSAVLRRVAGMPGQIAYFVSIVDEVVVFFFVVAMVAGDIVLQAWQIMWLGLSTVYLFNLLFIVVVRGRDKLYANLFYPFVFPGLVIMAFHLLIGRTVGVPKLLYLENSVLFFVSAILLIVLFMLFDFIVRANIEGLSVLDFTSVLILEEEKTLNPGVVTDVIHQALHIENETQSLSYNIPWLHPGPVEGFGGGRLTPELIGEDTFFLHIPSDHKLDLADPADIDRFQDMPDATLHSEVTKLFRVEKGPFTVWGRRYGDRPIVYIQNRDLDDYNPSIVDDIKQRYPDICLIDLHNQPIDNENTWLQDLDPLTDVLGRAVEQVMEKLDEAETHRYRAGVGGDRTCQALVEDVGGQRTCILGVDGNDAPDVLYRVEEELRDRYDEVLVFTTDSHKQLVELANPDRYTYDELMGAVGEAEDGVSDARAGIGERLVENVGVLGEHYNGLIFTMNIMARLIPVGLAVYYLSIVFLVL